MANRNKNILILFLIVGFIFISLGGTLLILGVLVKENLLLYIALGMIMVGVIIYSIMIILGLIYMFKRR